MPTYNNRLFVQLQNAGSEGLSLDTIRTNFSWTEATVRVNISHIRSQRSDVRIRWTRGRYYMTMNTVAETAAPVPLIYSRENHGNIDSLVDILQSALSFLYPSRDYWARWVSDRVRSNELVSDIMSNPNIPNDIRNYTKAWISEQRCRETIEAINDNYTIPEMSRALQRIYPHGLNAVGWAQTLESMVDIGTSMAQREAYGRVYPKLNSWLIAERRRRSTIQNNRSLNQAPDNLWLGIPNEVSNYYRERAMEFGA